MAASSARSCATVEDGAESIVAEPFALPLPLCVRALREALADKGSSAGAAGGARFAVPSASFVSVYYEPHLTLQRCTEQAKSLLQALT